MNHIIVFSQKPIRNRDTTKDYEPSLINNNLFACHCMGTTIPVPSIVHITNPSNVV